jgi:hypothetical protein
MGGTEDFIDKFDIDIGAPLLDGEKIIFDISQVLERFFYETLQYFIIFYRHKRFSFNKMVACSTSKIA